jgi:hypothetical protein
MTKRIVAAFLTFVAVGIGGALVIPFFHVQDSRAAGSLLFPVGLVSAMVVFILVKPHSKDDPPTDGPK